MQNDTPNEFHLVAMLARRAPEATPYRVAGDAADLFRAAKSLAAHCYGDPRGYVVRLKGDGVVQNGWGDGFGVA
jgi:hypothetical protein